MNAFCFVSQQGEPFLRASKSPEGQFAKPYRVYQLALPKTYVTRRGKDSGGGKELEERGGEGRMPDGMPLFSLSNPDPFYHFFHLPLSPSSLSFTI